MVGRTHREGRAREKSKRDSKNTLGLTILTPSNKPLNCTSIYGVNFCGWVLSVPKQVFVWVRAKNWRLPSGPINKNLIIGQTRRRNINQSVTSWILEDLLGKSERVKELHVDSRGCRRCDVRDDPCVDRQRIFSDNIQLSGREEGFRKWRVTPRRDQHDEDIFRSRRDEFTDLIGDQKWHRHCQPEEVGVNASRRHRARGFQ